MSLRRKIPCIPNSEFPFLEEVDFKKLSKWLEPRSLTPVAKTPAKTATTEDDKPRVPFGHLVDIQPELDRLRMIISSTEVNNAWITGLKGIGKTNVVEALLRARAEKRLTSQLMTRPYFIFDADSFAVASYGENSVKMFDKALTEAAKRDGFVIIDHMDDFLQTAGPALAGTLASTLVKHVETDRNLQAIIISESGKDKLIEDASTGIRRRFQTLEVTKEADNAKLKKILIAHFAGLEMTHNVNFSEETADEMIHLLSRYPGKAFKGARPHNAIMFADKVATYVRLNKYAEPAEVTEKREEIRLLQDQLNVIVTDGEPAKVKRERLELQIRDMTAEYAKMDETWKKKFEPLLKARQAFEEMEAKLTPIRNTPDADRSSSDRTYYDLCTEPKGKPPISLYDSARADIAAKEKALYPEPPLVEPKHARLIFARESGIPTSTLSQNKRERLGQLDPYLHTQIFGQDEVLQGISEDYWDREMGTSDPSKPAGITLVLGSTGVGKTEVADALARFDTADEQAKALVIELGEFKGKEAGKRLTGADPGYAGYEDGSCLEPVRSNPRSVVLFDEIEKCDPSVFDVMMQIPQTGRLVPSNSRVPIEFKETMIFLGSNAITEKDLTPEELGNEAKIREKLLTIRNADTGQLQFKPPFLGRIRRIYVMHDLSKPIIGKILRKEIDKVNRDFGQRGLTVQVSDETIEKIVDKHYDSTVGGRNGVNIASKYIRPVLQGYLKAHIDEVMNEDIKFQAHLSLEYDNGRLCLKPIDPSTPTKSTASKPAATAAEPH